jgi:hypothetical protein
MLGMGSSSRSIGHRTSPLREWYFFTNRATVCCVEPGTWKNDELIAFAFDHKPQDIERFQRAAREESSPQENNRRTALDYNGGRTA